MTNVAFNTTVANNNGFRKFDNVAEFKIPSQQPSNVASTSPNVADLQNTALNLLGPKQPVAEAASSTATQGPGLANPEFHSWFPQLPPQPVRTGSGQPMNVPQGLTTANHVANNAWANNNFNPWLNTVGMMQNFDFRTMGDAQTAARFLDPRRGDVSNPHAHIGTVRDAMNHGANPWGVTTTHQIGLNMSELGNTINFHQRANPLTGNLTFAGAQQIMGEAGLTGTTTGFLNMANPNGFATGISTEISPANLFAHGVYMDPFGNIKKDQFAAGMLAAGSRLLGTPVTDPSSWRSQPQPQQPQFPFWG